MWNSVLLSTHSCWGWRWPYNTACCTIFLVTCCSSAGLVHPQFRCHGCLVEGIAGMLWKCVKCFEYHLCTPCYAAGKHSVEHPFHRIDIEKLTERLEDKLLRHIYEILLGWLWALISFQTGWNMLTGCLCHTASNQKLCVWKSMSTHVQAHRAAYLCIDEWYIASQMVMKCGSECSQCLWF